jgi:hypothetical protein
VIATALALAVGPRVAGAQGQSLNVGAGLTTLHDDNILHYSNAQLQDFDSGLDPARFAIASTGDVVFNPLLALRWELDQGHGRRHAVRLKGEGEFHARDGNADFRSLSAGWRESFRRGRQLSIGYYILPHYYLRQLYDEDWLAVPASVRYRRAQFDLQIASAGWSQRAGRDRSLELAYQFERRRYGVDFRERDSGTHQGTLGFGWRRLPRQGAIDLHGGYRVSYAKGSDGDDPPGVVPDDADLSYHGMMGSAGGHLDLAAGDHWRLVGDVGYEIETRTYDSDRATDKYHLGRDDLFNAVELGLRTVVRPHWSLRAFYRLENDAAHLGSAAPLSSDVGSYRSNQVGLAIGWAGDVWRQSAGEEDTGASEP